jgi:sensor histidine kinase YesM
LTNDFCPVSIFHSATVSDLYEVTFLKDISADNRRGVALRGIATYLFCLGGFYFYDSITNGGNETRELDIIPYVVVSAWFAWFFIHNRILLRKLALEKKRIPYFASLITGLVVTSLIQQKMVGMIRGTTRPLIGIMVSLLFYTFLAALIFLTFEYMRRRKDFYQIDVLKKEMELQQLKSQLNPHFLFNALNNIYSYTLEGKTYGNDLILKLSQLMRFIIEAGPREFIPLSEEVGFIDNYIAFEKERLGERCTVLYEKNISSEERPIPPLLLFPFVENAFKHGTATIQPTSIFISLNDIEGILTLVVKNAITRKATVSTKTGLNNIIRRLDLLFPDKHKLTIDSGEREYQVKLELYR